MISCRVLCRKGTVLKDSEGGAARSGMRVRCSHQGCQCRTSRFFYCARCHSIVCFKDRPTFMKSPHGRTTSPRCDDKDASKRQGRPPAHGYTTPSRQDTSSVQQDQIPYTLRQPSYRDTALLPVAISQVSPLMASLCTFPYALPTLYRCLYYRLSLITYSLQAEA